jgi:integrase/recombinase XerD
LKACDSDPSKLRAIQLRALVLLMRHSGLRLGDACTLARDRITDGILTLRTEKGGTTVRLPLHPDALAALKLISETNGFYFWTGTSKRRSVTNMWQALLLEMFKRSGIDGHSHQFRHTFAVDLLVHGVSMENLSVLLGHRNIRITQTTYSAFTPARRDALEEAVRSTWAIKKRAGKPSQKKLARR